MNFTDPDPQKLLRINPLKITVKKLCVHHTYLNGQAAIYIPKSVFASRVDPGSTREVKYIKGGLPIEVRMMKT